MLKVFGFVQRHPSLTHDEYRAGHVGYHNSFGRRLNNIRGYLLNVNANRSLAEVSSGEFVDSISRDEPQGFDERWDAWGQLLFDTLDDYLAARSPARDLAGPNGLQEDERVAGVGGDFDQLYSGSPFQFHVDEYLIEPVVRPEHKTFKIVQFIKRSDGVDPLLFRGYLTGRYAQMLRTLPQLCGLTINFRTDLDVMTGFFAPDTEGFTVAGKQRRERFYSDWDVMIEYWFESPAGWIEGRNNPDIQSRLADMESDLMARSFYREVDETVAVLPNRAPAPDFYFR